MIRKRNNVAFEMHVQSNPYDAEGMSSNPAVDKDFFPSVYREIMTTSNKHLWYDHSHTCLLQKLSAYQFLSNLP